MSLANTDAAAPIKANRRGILSMSAAMACFIVNDALVKYTTQTMPVAQLICVRSIMASMFVLAVAHATGATARIGVIAHARVAARGVIDAIASLMYVFSLFHLPLANATAINMTSPLFITLLAVVFLGERVDWRRWLAVGAGFAGVLLVIQPQAGGFNAFAFLCLAATALYAVRDLMTRRIAVTVPAILITLATAIAAVILSGIVSLIEGWRPFGLFELGRLALAAVFLAAAYYLVIDGMRYGEVSVTAPFRYTALLWALAVGFAVWGDVPDALGWCGIALLMGSGVYVLHGERRRIAAKIP